MSPKHLLVFLFGVVFLTSSGLELLRRPTPTSIMNPCSYIPGRGPPGPCIAPDEKLYVYKSPIEKPPTYRPPVEKPHVYKPPEKPPTYKPPVEKPPVAKPPTYKSPVEKPPVYKPPVEKPPTYPTPSYDHYPKHPPSTTEN